MAEQYRIIQVKDRKTLTYRATVPTTSGDLFIKMFSKHFYKDPLLSAQQWQQRMGIKEWGAERWNLITRGALQAVKGRGVACYVGYTLSKNKHGIKKHPQYVVSWRNLDGSKQSKVFSPKKYGTLTAAGKAARQYQVQKRAERSRNLLNLPPELSAGLGYGD